MQFRTRPEGFVEIRNRAIIIMFLVSGAILAIVAGPGLFSESADERQTSLITVAFLSVVLVATTAYTLKKQKEQFLSIVITIDQGIVTCDQVTLPTVSMRANEIAKIERQRAGSILIQGVANKKIAVPSQMENYNEMIACLATLKPITEVKTNYAAMSVLSMAGMLVLIACNFLVTNRTISIISYSLSVIVLIVSLVLIQRSNLVPRKTKRLTWLVLIPILAFLSILIERITG